MLQRRCEGKRSDGYVFHELPTQTNEARKRSSPMSQFFTRERRRLEVDDVLEGVRQSRIDFHSWRRWFIRQAIEALEKGATGFSVSLAFSSARLKCSVEFVLKPDIDKGPSVPTLLP